MSKGWNDRAEVLLRRTMELNSAFAPAKFEYARIMLEKRNYEDAFRKFYEALLLEPENSRYIAFYAYAAALSDRNNIAAESIAEALKLSPRNNSVHYIAGLIKLHQRDITAAEKSLREAIRHSPADMLALEALGDVLTANFKYGEAVGKYLTVWKTAGYSERVAYKLGKALAADRKFREANDFITAIVNRNPDNGEAIYRLVEIHCELGDARQAAAALERFAGKHPVWHQVARGRFHEAANERDMAWSAYSTAARMDRANPHAAAGLGRLLFKQGDYNAAIKQFEVAAALDPANAQALIYKAIALEKKGSRDEAVEVYKSIIARSPQQPHLYLSIAANKETQGNMREAIKALNDGLEANPNNAELLFTLGRLYQETKQYERAITAYQAAIGGRKAKVGPNNAETLKIIGEIYYTKLTDEKKAREFFKRYVRAGGKDSGVDDILKKLSGKERG